MVRIIFNCGVMLLALMQGKAVRYVYMLDVPSKKGNMERNMAGNRKFYHQLPFACHIH
jgi:hypothetical protein